MYSVFPLSTCLFFKANYSSSIEDWHVGYLPRYQWTTISPSHDSKITSRLKFANQKEKKRSCAKK